MYAVKSIFYWSADCEKAVKASIGVGKGLDFFVDVWFYHGVRL